jgi:glucose-1-phosphate adenylyltransferase
VAYWRDVGTVAAYWQANMDLVSVIRLRHVQKPAWPIRTWALPLPPAKFVFADEEHAHGRRHRLAGCEGVIISGRPHRSHHRRPGRHG